MGIRSKLKAAVKRAVLRDSGPSSPAPRPAPPPTPKPPPESGGRGNLADGEDVPWYLKDGDADGWEHTDVKAAVDED